VNALAVHFDDQVRHTLPNAIFLESDDESTFLLALRSNKAYALLIGPKSENPLAIAQRMAKVDEQLSVLIVPNKSEEKQVRKQRLVTPYLGVDVRVLGEQGVPQLKIAVDRAVLRTITRHLHKKRGKNIEPLLKFWRPKTSILLEKLFEQLPIGLAVLDPDYQIQLWNNPLEKITGISLEQARNYKRNYTKYESSTSLFMQMILEFANSNDQDREIALDKFGEESNSLYLMASRQTLLGSSDKQGSLLIIQDITERKQVQTELSYQASHDILTGLINRREFEQRANRLLSTIQQEEAEHAMCFLDLDQFKVINDTCGHTAGDELLRQLGKVLQDTARKRDTIARLGGDEFGLLMEHCPLDQAYRVAEAILEAVSDYRFYWEGASYRIGVSIGLIEITQMTGNYSELFKQADTACYLAKDLGRNRIHVYHSDDTEMAIRHREMQWVGRINQALDEDRFCLYAQPIIALDKSELKHYELLLRMMDEKGNIILPGIFLPAAEHYDLIEKLDYWALNRTCGFMMEHPEFVEQINFVSINLSGQSLTNNDFLKTIMKKIKQSKVPADKFCFEVTETVAISNIGSAANFISTLKQIGCHFALDDFGSGLSSFGYLKGLPVDYLKIDGMFVKDIVDDPIDHAMVKSINEIGQLMGMQTIAEFVENDEIKGMLKAIGVNFGQGYGLGKPRPLENLLD
jgi:diguanylate cyclase (GGDEF)-like protein/PAS domain S-box-containing protein